MSTAFVFQYMTETPLRSLIQLIINTYFFDSYCINIISLEVGVLNLTVPAVYINGNLNNADMKSILLETWEMGCTDSLVQVKDPTNIVDIFEENVHIGNERNGERKIIFVPTEEDDKDVENILKEKSLAFVANVLVLSRDHNNNNCTTYNIFTHKFKGISENDEPILLDVWSCNGFKFENNLFPHDMSDLEGKVVKVAAFTYEPYAILDLNVTKTPEGYDGTEIRIVMEFCRWLNCTIELVVDKKYFWGQIFDNRTGNGVLGAVAMDHADLGITALYSWYDAYKFLDLSMPAIRTGITCLVPSPTFVPGWRLAIIPFKGDTWMSVGGTLLGLIVVLWFIAKYPLMDAAFLSFRFMILQCSKATMMRSIRVVLIWYVLGGMLLDSFYSSSLASSLTVPRYGASIDTVENLRDSNIEWGATHDAWIFSIESSTEPIMVDLVNKFKILSKEQLSAKAKRGNFGFSIERLPAGHYAVGDYVQEEALPRLQLMQEDIYWEQCLMMARKSSPYTRKYNQLLGRLHSSGLQLAWETQVVQKYLNMHVQIGVRHSHDQHRLSKVEGFAFNKVLGAFIVLGLGYSMAAVALISTTSIGIILQTIFHRYLSDSYCVTFVSDENMDADLFPKPIIYLNANDERNLAMNMLNASELGCSDYFIQMNRPNLFMDAFEANIHRGNVRRSDRKLIFLTSSNTKENINSLLNILPMKGSQFIANILLILPSEERGSKCEEYEFVTHKYVGSDGNDEPISLDTWNACKGQFNRNGNLFPHDMTDLQGKVLRVAGFTYKPYILLDVNTSLAPLGYDGTEVRIVVEFCRWTNCVIEFVRDDDAEWGEIFENGTGNGVLGNVVEDRADIGITALYTWYHEYLFLDMSAPYIRTGITCIVPAPRLLPGWELPIMPFSGTMWGAVLFTFLFAALALTFAQRGSTDRVLLTTFGILVTQTQPDSVTTGSSKRYVVIWLLMTGLVLDNAYSGGLASVFTVPKYEKAIDTVQDLVDADMQWGATHDAWIFSLLLATEPNLVYLRKKFTIYGENELRMKGKTRDYAFSIERLPAGYYAIGEYIDEEAVPYLQLMQEDIYWEQCVTMARKSSPYIRKYEQLLGRLHSSGLLLAWETQVVLKHSNFKVQLGVHLSQNTRTQESEVKGLNFQSVMGIFILLGFGTVASTIAFIGELIHGRHKHNII